MMVARGVLAARLVLLLAALGAALGGLVVAGGGDPFRRGAGSAPGGYACPMHAQVVAARAGDCPICGMALVPRVGAAEVSRKRAPTAGLPPGWSWDDTMVRLGLQVPTQRPMWEMPSGPAWIDVSGAVVASLYKDEIGGLAADEPGTFLPAGAPDAGVVVRRVTPPAPPRPDRRAATASVWFRPTGGGQGLTPGTTGWVKLGMKPRPVLLAPVRAVLDAADGPYVLVAAPGSREITRRPIEIGRVFHGDAAVMSGLGPSDQLVTAGAFFVDAELRA